MTFQEWYKANEAYLVTQPYTNYVAAAAWKAAQAEERERAARVCDDEARIRSEAASKHPEGSYSQERCIAAARAAINCAAGVRSGEVIE